MAIPSEQQTRENLRKENHFKIRIKPEQNNANYVTERVFVDGVCYQIPVVEEVEVPETIYELLKTKGIM